MANNPKLSDAAANASVDAVCALLDNGYLRIYDGAQPTDADTAIGAQVLLAELRFGATAFGAAANGVASANAITSEDSALANSTATWFRALGSDGTTTIFDGTVGTGAGDLNLITTTITIGMGVAVSTFTYTQNQG